MSKTSRIDIEISVRVTHAESISVSLALKKT